MKLIITVSAGTGLIPLSTTAKSVIVSFVLPTYLLKVLKSEMDTQELLPSFQYEDFALAGVFPICKVNISDNFTIAQPLYSPS
ncbi:MAG: hypothetical protein IKJ06_02680, partial [Clostridia bacterium]|nr:hypothetical protein [Clostridia bacterium]